ncbi:MAG TPA: ABC transporter substrate-binding protein [Dehalococcoidales bacterium]|nr:ABC transporter substrate-binding protein [Dehalococcoidales bacterium]
MKYGGILKVIRPAAPPQFGWTPTFAAGEVNGANPAVEALVSFDKTGSPFPKLATDWQIAPDGKSITFNLRKGVKFHDNTDFNAEAVKYNIDLEMKLRPGELPGVKSVDVVDEFTVRMNLDYFANNLWDRMGSRALISSPAHLAKGEDAVKFFPLGTGPFKFVEWKRDAYIKFERNDNYWQEGKPYLDGIEILFISDPMTASAALLAGEADQYTQPGFKEAADLVARGYRVAAVPGLIMGLAPDTRSAGSIYNDIKVREAIEYAIDRGPLVETLGYGFLEARTQFIPPGYLGYVAGLERKYNPEKARQLLAEAGYPDGLTTTIIADAEFVSRDMMSAIQAYLADVNITAKIDYADPGRYADWRRKSGWENSLMFMRNGGFPWPPNLSAFILDENRNDYSSMERPEGLQETLVELLTAQDFNTQSNLSQKMTRMLFEHATFVPLYTQYSLAVTAPYVHDDGAFETVITQWTPEDCWLDK